MFKVVISAFGVVISIFIILLQEQPLLYNEIYNSIVIEYVINTAQQQNVEDYTIKIHGFLNNSITDKINTYTVINTEHLIQDTKNHTYFTAVLITTLIMSITMLILIKKIRIVTYEHEVSKLKAIIRITIEVIILTFIYFKEELTNIFIKKNITVPEIIYTQPIATAEIEIYIAILYIILYNSILQKEKNEKQIKMLTKIVAWGITVIVATLIAQYSIYETITMLIYAEILNQYIHIKEVYHKKCNSKSLY